MICLDIQRMKARPMPDNDIEIGISFNDFSRNGGNTDDHSVGLMLLHIFQNIRLFQIPAHL